MSNMSNESEIRKAAVVEALRQVANWGLTWGDGKDARDELRGIADQVDLLRSDDMCCPLCEEVECDDDCALRGMRG